MSRSHSLGAVIEPGPPGSTKKSVHNGQGYLVMVWLLNSLQCSTSLKARFPRSFGSPWLAGDLIYLQFPYFLYISTTMKCLHAAGLGVTESQGERVVQPLPVSVRFTHLTMDMTSLDRDP